MGFLPPQATIQASPSSVDPAPLSISQPDLIAALGDQERFYDLYVTVTNRALDLYVKAGRKKFAVKHHAALAALDM